MWRLVQAMKTHPPAMQRRVAPTMKTRAPVMQRVAPAMKTRASAMHRVTPAMKTRAFAMQGLAVHLLEP
ncbi:hypothetical protein AMTRI_Chr07g24490 [Amborella trichopoda]